MRVSGRHYCIQDIAQTVRSTRLLRWLAVSAVRHQFGIAQDGVEAGRPSMLKTECGSTRWSLLGMRPKTRPCAYYLAGRRPRNPRWSARDRFQVVPAWHQQDDVEMENTLVVWPSWFWDCLSRMARHRVKASVSRRSLEQCVKVRCQHFGTSLRVAR
jgi:hypothetical protein